jgi:hypothetical protein
VPGAAAGDATSGPIWLEGGGGGWTVSAAGGAPHVAGCEPGG